MLTNHALFRRKLDDLISQEIERLKESLTTIHVMEDFDFATYKHQVGIIRGLRQALELVDEAQAIVNGKEEGA
jgi:hypothetical protein